MLGINAVYCPLHHPLAHTRHRGYVGITELYDAIAIKSFRQVRRSILNMVHLKLLETEHETIARKHPYNNSTRDDCTSPHLAWQNISE